ncbi:transposase [Planctomycetota bacterium]
MEEITDIERLWRGQLFVELETFEAVKASLRKVEDKLNSLGSADARIRRLQTIPGVGPRLAETVVAFLDDPDRFENSKQVGSYAGLIPKQYQSGQMERQGKISGQSNKLLRNLLVEICWVSLRYNPWVRDTYQRLLEREFGVVYSLWGVYDLLHRLGYSCLCPRPQHEKADP